MAGPGATGTGGGWRVLWRHDHESPGTPVSAGAVAVLPCRLPTPGPRVVVTEEWSGGEVGLRCDNTHYFRLADGVPDDATWVTYKNAFATPRIEVCTVDDAHVAVVNTSRGLVGQVCCPRHGDPALPGRWGSTDGPALDLVVARAEGRAVVVGVWTDGSDAPAVHTYDVRTGAAVGAPWRLPRQGDRPAEDGWRLGRWDGRPVAVEDLGWMFSVRDGVTGRIDGLVVLDDWIEPSPGDAGLLAFDDAIDGGGDADDEDAFGDGDGAGSALVLVGRRDAVHCYSAATGERYRPPLTGSGTIVGARLGRCRGRSVAAVLTSTGLSVHDLRAPGWVRHVDLGVPVHDVAFASQGRLALSTRTGPMLVEVAP